MNEFEIDRTGKVIMALDIIETIVDKNLLLCLDESDREKARCILKGSTVMLLNQLGAINEEMELKLRNINNEN